MRTPPKESKIKEIKAFFSCRDMVKRYYPDHFREQGNSLCPFHNDSSPSMQITDDFAFCHGCNKKLDVIDLYELATGKSRAEAIHDLSVAAGIEKESVHSKEAVRPKSTEEFFRLRGFSDEFLASLFESGQLRKSSRPGFFEALLTNKKGESAGFQQIEYTTLKGGRKAFTPGTKAKEEAFFHLPGNGQVVVTEGVLDAMSVKAATPDADVYSILSATFAGSSKIDSLPRIPVLAFDNDKAGRDATERVIRRLNGRCRVVDWSSLPFGLEDPNELLREGKTSDISSLVESAKMPSMIGFEVEDDEDSAIHYLPPPPIFPVEVFPQSIQRIIYELATAFDVAPDVAACAILSFVGACIGRTRAIRLKKGWTEHPNLFLAIVGESGIGKSPVGELIKSILVSFEVKWRAEYDRKMAQYMADMAEYKRKLKDGDLDATAPEKPVLREIMAEDATIEGVGEMLKANPRGVIWLRDELTGLLLDLDKYSGKEGSARSRLLSAFNASLWKNTRKDSSKNSFIEKALLSICGTIQEKLLAGVFSQSDTDSGFTPRFLMCRVVKLKPPEWSETSVSESTLETLKRIFGVFLDWDFDDNRKPCMVDMSPVAKKVYVEWFEKQASEPWRDPEAREDKALLAKNRSYAARLALILHSLDAALKADGENKGLSEISEEHIRGGIKLTECFTEHHRQIKRFFLSSNESGQPKKAFDSIQQRIVKAIVALENEIHQGMLSTSRITDEVNRNQPETMQINSRQTGKIVKSLGLSTKHTPDKKGRGAVISAKELKQFRSFILAGNNRSSFSAPLPKPEPEMFFNIYQHSALDSKGTCSTCSSWKESNPSYGICHNADAKQSRFKQPSESCERHYAGGVPC